MFVCLVFVCLLGVEMGDSSSQSHNPLSLGFFFYFLFFFFFFFFFSIPLKILSNKFPLTTHLLFSFFSFFSFSLSSPFPVGNTQERD